MTTENDTLYIKERMRSILEAEARAVASIPVGDGYARAVELIVDRVHRRNGKLVTSGMGKAGQIAMNIATTFCSTGAQQQRQDARDSGARGTCLRTEPRHTRDCYHW